MGGEEMRMKNAAGRAIYINAVEKRGKVVFVVKAIGDNRIMSRDKAETRSRCRAGHLPRNTRHGPGWNATDIRQIESAHSKQQPRQKWRGYTIRNRYFFPGKKHDRNENKGTWDITTSPKASPGADGGPTC